jgi:alanine racemase
VSGLPPADHRPTWAEIDLDRLAHNLTCLRGRLGATGVMAVVKADAYGHGAVPVARRLEREGVEWLAVARPEEGATIRQAGVRTPILVMGGLDPGQADLVLAHDLTAAVYREDQVAALSTRGERRGTPAPVHVKIDTGMGRLGVPAADVDRFAGALAAAKGIEVTGAFSHLAAADDREDPFTAQQTALFLKSVAVLRAHGLRPTQLHLANSAAIIDQRATWMTVARAGLLLYGYNPVDRGLILPVRPVLSMKSRVVDLKDLPVGASIGYGRTWRAPSPARIATLPIGYADGLPRSAGGRGRVLLRGRPAPIVGRINMDLTTVDVTAHPEVEIGDVATVIGADEGQSIGADALAAAAGTIAWEILARIGPRVPRLVIDSGQTTLQPPLPAGPLE